MIEHRQHKKRLDDTMAGQKWTVQKFETPDEMYDYVVDSLKSLGFEIFVFKENDNLGGR